MLRKAFVMSVNEGQETEYIRRHNPIWPDLEAVLKDHGVHNYSIFLHRPTRQLFAYVEIENVARWEAIAETLMCQKWWKFMCNIMPSHHDNSPITSMLHEVFHLD